jgi:glycerol-3-phosphate acyltransferase PlsX
VGLLANGEEESKGTDLTRAAAQLLKKLDGPLLEYVGYVEGKDLFGGDVDVVATDGFTGNIVLKTVEGAASAITQMLKKAFLSSSRAKLGALLARPALEAWRDTMDYERVGGAPLLGCGGLAIVSHGRSSPVALKNAILAAARYAERGLVPAIQAALAEHTVGDAQGADAEEAHADA